MDIEGRLLSIETELKAVGHREIPERKLRALIRNMNRTELQDWRPNLAQVIELHFLPKRRRALLEFLGDEIAGRPMATHGRPGRARPAAQQGRAARIAAASLSDEFRQELRELSERHIFQWTTRYQECLFRYFDLYITQQLDSPTLPIGVSSLRQHLDEHSCEIFTKGYNYSVGSQGSSQSDAIDKSVVGLTRFLEVPLGYYSARASRSHDQRTLIALRTAFSDSVLGILSGFATVRLGETLGSQILAQSPEKWADSLGFLTPACARETAGIIHPGVLREGIVGSVLPLLEVIEHFVTKKHEDYFPIPLQSRFSLDDRCLQVSVRSPPSSTSRFLEVEAYWDDALVSQSTIDRAHHQRVTLVVAPLRADVRVAVLRSPVLRELVVDTHEVSAPVVESAVSRWGKRIFKLRTMMAGPALTYNIAREFPLLQPSSKIPRFYRVQRTSVRELLGTSGHRNGVRLWCSVRRSGKTTACLDLDTNLGDAVIISQTCGTAASKEERFLYDRVSDALTAGAQIDDEFVESTVTECARETVDELTRKILIIDEYETLFGRVSATVRQNDLARYTVVQPLLNQLVEFARDNLLVLMGQQPDAHFILMDQNQLAPYVEQEPFPLFAHVAGKKSGEFSALVRKIFSDQIDFDASFLDALYAETAGHPFLTANTLCVMGDWLIEERRPADRLELERDDFVKFRNTQLRPGKMIRSPDYSFFREAAREALGRLGYESNTWLFAVYWLMRELARNGGREMMCPRDELAGLIEGIPAPGPLPDTAEILRTATQANFLRYADEQVSVRIRTLGRVAAAVRPKLG